MHFIWCRKQKYAKHTNTFGCSTALFIDNIENRCQFVSNNSRNPLWKHGEHLCILSFSFVLLFAVCSHSPIQCIADSLSLSHLSACENCQPSSVLERCHSECEWLFPSFVFPLCVFYRHWIRTPRSQIPLQMFLLAVIVGKTFRKLFCISILFFLRQNKHKHHHHTILWMGNETYFISVHFFCVCHSILFHFGGILRECLGIQVKIWIYDLVQRAFFSLNKLALELIQSRWRAT